MHRKWWKAYFFIVLALTVGGLALPLFIEFDREMAWWEWLYFPLYAVQIVGLFGYVYWRRLGVPLVWQAVFVASLMFEVWDVFHMSTDPEFQGTGYEGFIASTVAATLIIQVPMLIGLFLYGFRSKELWHGAT